MSRLPLGAVALPGPARRRASQAAHGKHEPPDDLPLVAADAAGYDRDESHCAPNRSAEGGAVRERQRGDECRVAAAVVPSRR